MAEVSSVGDLRPQQRLGAVPQWKPRPL